MPHEELQNNPANNIDVIIARIDSKIQKQEKKIAEIDEKISALQEQKKKAKAEIEKANEEKILALIRSSKLSFEQISDSIQLALSLNTTVLPQTKSTDNDDLSKLTEDLEQEKTTTRRDFGGYSNVNI